MVMRLMYSQFLVALVRNSDGSTGLVVDVELDRKWQRRGRDNKHGESHTFTITLVEYYPICLANLVLARAIQDDAFQQEFRSVSEIFNRPNMSTSQYLRLPFKTELHEKDIFHIEQSAFYSLWHRSFDVAGFEEHHRPYSLRVGAGQRLDVKLPNSIRNYILGHYQATFQSYYQSHRVQEDLLSLAFQRKGRSELFRELGNMSLIRYQGAPLSVSPEAMSSLECRRDIATLRRLIALNPQYKDNLARQANNLLRTLRELLLARARTEYFKKAAALRQCGKEPADQSFSRGATGSAVCVAQLITESMKDNCPGAGPRPYIEAFLSYLRGPPPSSARFEETTLGSTTSAYRGWDSKEDTALSSDENTALSNDKRNSEVIPRCLLCQRTYTKRYNLTKHYKKKHLGNFDKPFPCSLCHEEIHDSMAWCSHIARIHGEEHLPQLHGWKTRPNLVAMSIPCPFLCNLQQNWESFVKLIHKYHVNRLACMAVSREQIHDWFHTAQKSSLWHLARTLPLCTECGWLGLTPKGLATHARVQHKILPSLPMITQVADVKKRQRDEDTGLTEKAVKRQALSP